MSKTATSSERPPILDIDLPDREGAENAAKKSCKKKILGNSEKVKRLRKVLYPVYIVDYSIKVRERFLVFQGKERRKYDRVIIDGMDFVSQTKEDHLNEYESIVPTDIEKTDETARVDPVEIGHRVSPDRIHGNQFLIRKARENYDGFEGMLLTEQITPVYLPFWAAGISTPGEDSKRVVAFRSTTITGAPKNIDWVSSIIMDNKKLRSKFFEEPFQVTQTNVDDSKMEMRLEESAETPAKAENNSPKDSSAFDDEHYTLEEAREKVQTTSDDTSNDSNPREVTTEGGESDNTTDSAEETSMKDTADAPDPSDAEYVTESPKLTFEHVGGMTDLKQRLRSNVIQPIQEPDKYQEYGLSTVNGVLLYGPPGTGKTYLSKALAGELGYNYIEINPSDIVSGKVAELPNKINEVFQEAREYQPTVVFIDEIDAIAAERSSSDTRTENQGVNELLQQLSDLNESDNDVVVIAATNRPDKLDDALIRTGRLDIKEEVPNPDAEARAVILYKQVQDRPVGDDVDWELLAKETEGLSASDLEAIAEQAARNALEDDEPIHHEHLLEAIDEIDTSDELKIDSDLLDPTPDMDFSDVGGMDDLKQDLEREVIEPLTNPERFEEYGLDVVNGVLLHGPPGTGKTYMSKALAGELGFNYAKIEPDDIMSKWINESVENVGEIFEAARENEPCLVFIDELDAVASERGGQNKHQDQDNTVNQLLNEMSEVNESDDDVVVVAATNNLEEVDEAMRRSGRFDKKVEVPAPDLEARREILRVHLEGRPAQEDIDLERVAEETEGMVASDLELLVEEAAREAMYDGEDVGTEYLVGEAVGDG